MRFFGTNAGMRAGAAIAAVIASLLLSAVFGCAYAEGEEQSEEDRFAEPPEVKAESAILIDAKTGDVLFAKEPDARHAPASCTKIMTAILALENLDPDEIITVTEEAAYTEGSSVGLAPDEEVRAGDLFYALLLESGNDAAEALAIGVDGSIGKFAERMNARAEQLGLTQTHFTNPHGLNDPEHYTTARDLAYIAQEAMRNEDFRSYVTTYEYTMPPTNLLPERILHNSNRMLYDENRKITVYGEEIPVKYPDGTGIKTGYTSDAGSCLVSGAKRDGLELISVVLKSEGMDMYADTVNMLEYGLHNFEEVTYLKKGDVMFDRPVTGADQQSVGLAIAEDLTATIRKGEQSSYFVDGEVTSSSTDGALAAPFKSGDVFGRAWIKDAAGQVVASVDLVAQSSIAQKKEPEPSAWDEGVGTLSLVLKIVGIACLIAIVVVVIAIIRATVMRRRRRRNRMYGAKLSSSVDPLEVRRIKNLNRQGRRRR